MTDDAAQVGRREAADQAFELYDHGDMVVGEAEGWETDTGTDTWERNVYIEMPNSDRTTKLRFVVRFQPNSPEVIESYYGGH